MAMLGDPWFWAFVAAVGWVLSCGLIGSETLGRRLSFGMLAFVLVEGGRIVLPLGFVAQPRLEAGMPGLGSAGAVLLAGSLLLATPIFRIVPLTAPSGGEPLRTDGLYSVVRHPLMLCELLWPVGLALLCGSLIGLALAPVWGALIWVLTHLEEEALVREYGDDYRRLQERVPRLLPRLPGFGGRESVRARVPGEEETSRGRGSRTT